MGEIRDVKVRYTQMFHFNLCQPAGMSGATQSFPKCWRRENMTLFWKEGKMLNIQSQQSVTPPSSWGRSEWLFQLQRSKEAFFHVGGNVKLFVLPLSVLLPNLPPRVSGVTSKINSLHWNTASGGTYWKYLVLKEYLV